MTISSGFVLLSIQSEHAEKIYSGLKRAELRKTFTSQARIVFVYETAPVSAITGVFLVGDAVKTSVEEAIGIAEQSGITRNRALEYYGIRESVWVITISSAIRFSRHIPIRDLRAKDHYFSPPQSFLYLNKFEGLTQDLLTVLRLHLANALTLRKLSSANRQMIITLIRSEIGMHYEDIDDDFIQQVLDEDVSAEMAFSTVRKEVMEFVWEQELVGFTVISVKQHGAWKSGPSILLPSFRGILFGQELRRAIETYCMNHGAKAIYCTCSASQPAVVSYLLNSGMQLQACLKSHLARDRDELVFSKNLISSKTSQPPRIRAVVTPLPAHITRIFSDDKDVVKACKFFINQMQKWYFNPHEGLYRSIVDSLKLFENGEQAYSAKGRAIYGCFDANNRICAAVLLTPKRSKMLKMNLVSVTKNNFLLKRLINLVLKDFANCRRLYVTVPTRELIAIEAFFALDFSFEGILQDPFSVGMNHACFGKVMNVIEDHSSRIH